ncbi:MAG: OmpA family protein [Ignavibacteria bacterium]|nr:OmpA family protein [Ignavibacteria bacterium]
MVSDNSSATGKNEDKGNPKFNLSKNNAAAEKQSGDKFNLSKSNPEPAGQGNSKPLNLSKNTSGSSRQAGVAGFNLSKSDNAQGSGIDHAEAGEVKPKTIDIKKPEEKVDDKKEEKVPSGGANPKPIDLKKTSEKTAGKEVNVKPFEEKGKSKIAFWVLGVAAVIVLVFLLLPGKDKSKETVKPGNLADTESATNNPNNDQAGKQVSGDPAQSTTSSNPESSSADGSKKADNGTGQKTDSETKSGAKSGANDANPAGKEGNTPQSSPTTNPKPAEKLTQTAPRGKVVYNFGYNAAAIVYPNKELNDLVEQLKKNPSSKLTIVGFTDNTGLEKYNQILSEQRAMALYYYLLNNGIAANRMKTLGMADKNPLYDNSTEEGRNGNRRVEFTIE